jgi:hypothetical protein
MLSIYRCDEIAAEALKNFHNSIAPMKKTLDSGSLIEDFGNKATEFYKQLLGVYDAQAMRYHPEIAAQKRETLSNSASDLLLALYIKQLSKIVEVWFSSHDF